MSALIKRNPDGNAINPPKTATYPVGLPADTSERISGIRLFTGCAVALAADALNIALPLFTIPVDFVTAVLMSLVFGWRRPIIAVTIIEAIPIAAMFPTWTLFFVHYGVLKNGK
jgi:hypothetical protein